MNSRLSLNFLLILAVIVQSSSAILEIGAVNSQRRNIRNILSLKVQPETISDISSSEFSYSDSRTDWTEDESIYGDKFNYVEGTDSDDESRYNSESESESDSDDEIDQDSDDEYEYDSDDEIYSDDGTEYDSDDVIDYQQN